MKLDNRYHKIINGKQFPFKAKKDLLCYKVIQMIDMGLANGIKWRTPLIFSDIIFDKEMSTTMMEPYTHDGNILYGFHSFQTENQAVKFAEMWHIPKYAIFESYVPRGASYYIFVDGAIASDKIKITSKQTKNNYERSIEEMPYGPED